MPSYASRTRAQRSPVLPHTLCDNHCRLWGSRMTSFLCDIRTQRLTQHATATPQRGLHTRFTNSSVRDPSIFGVGLNVGHRATKCSAPHRIQAYFKKRRDDDMYAHGPPFEAGVKNFSWARKQPSVLLDTEEKIEGRRVRGNIKPVNPSVPSTFPRTTALEPLRKDCHSGRTQVNSSGFAVSRFAV